MTAPNASVIQLVGLASGEPTGFDGQYLVEYDPTRPGRDPQGREMLAHIVTTADPGLAKRFSSAAEVHAVWTARSGLPYPRNAPLTAFTIAVLPVAEILGPDPDRDSDQAWRDCAHRADYDSPAHHARECPYHRGEVDEHGLPRPDGGEGGNVAATPC